MDILSVLVIDDDEISLEATKEALGYYIPKEKIFCTTDMKSAILILKSEAINLILLDIEMKINNGFEVAQFLKREYPGIPFIFLTGHTQFALEGYAYAPLDFLTKPVNLLRLKEALEKASEKNKANAAASGGKKIGINVEGGFTLLNIDEIIYIEKKMRKVYIYSKNGELHITRYTMEQLQNIFEEFDFFRTHQSFLVPIKQISNVEIDEFRNSYIIHLKDSNVTVPLSRNKYGEFKETLKAKGIRFV